MKRRMLSVTLAVLIVISGLVALLPLSASAGSSNLITNGNFETGDLSGWQYNNNSGNTSAAFTVTGDTTNKYVNGIAGLSLFKQVSLEAGVEYTMSFDFKFDEGTVPLTKPDGTPTYFEGFYRAGFVTNLNILSKANFVGPYATVSDKYYPTYSKQISQGGSLTTWKTHTFTFKPDTAMTVYAVIGSYNNQCVVGMNIDNVILCKTSDLVTVTANAETGGTAVGTKTTCKGDSVTVAATPTGGYHFDGWYNGATLVSAEQNYTFIADSSLTLTAKFSSGVVSHNMLTNGDFNNGSIADFEVNNNTTNTSAAFTFEGDTNKFLSGIAGLSLFKKVTLEAGVEYTMSFDFKFTSESVPAGFNTYYRAGFVTSVGAIGKSNFIGPNTTSTTGDKYYDIYFTQKNSQTTWMTHTFKFTPATTMSVYAVVGSYDKNCVAGFSMDNLVLCKTSDMATIGVSAEAGGTATGGKTVLKGEQVTVTAVPSTGFSFDGWYLNDAPVSTDEAYTFYADANVNFVAKFQDNTVITKKNLMNNGDFEEGSWTNGWTKISSSLSYIWDVNSTNFVAGDTEALNGTRYVKSGATESTGYTSESRSFGQKNIALKKNTDYVLAFWAKSDLPTFRAGVIRNDQVHPVAQLNDGTVVELAAGSTIALDKGNSWAYYVIHFNSGSNTVAAVSFGSQLPGIEGKYYYLDNVVLSKASDYITVSATATKGGKVEAPSGVVSAGTAVTVKAFPNDGNVFEGWYNGNTLVSADSEYTFTVTESVDLTAKFSSINLITNGNFEEGSWTNGWTKINSTLSYIWDVNSTNFVTGDTASLNGTRYVKSGANDSIEYSGQSRSFGQTGIVLQPNTDYVLAFWAKSDLPTFRAGVIKNDQVHPTADVALTPGSTIALDKGSSWAFYKISFNSGSNTVAAVSFGSQLSGIAGKYYYFDNVMLSKKTDVSALSVEAFGPGTASSSANGIVMPGSSVTLTATPFPGATFLGWYENSVLISTSATYQYTVTGSTALIAQFGNGNGTSTQKLYNSHFERGNLSGWSIGTVGDAINTKLITESGKTFVSIPKDNQLYQSVELKPHGVYSLTVKARTPGIRSVEHKDWYRAGVFGINTPNVLKESTIIPAERTWVDVYTAGKDGKGDTGWNTYTYYFTNSSSETVLANVVIGNAYNPPAFEVEYATFYEVVSGIMDFNTSFKYGEEFYNYIPNANFEQTISNENWGQVLPSGWNIYAGHKETGNKFLTVSNSDKTYAIKADPNTAYYFGVSLKTEKAGNSTFSLVDKNGVVLGDSYSLLTTKAVYKPSANGKWQRFGAELFTDADGYVYIKLSGKNNVLSIDDVTLVKERYGKATDPNYYGGDDSFDYNNPTYYNPVHFYSVDTGTDNGNDESPNANTGDHSNMVYLVLIASILGCGFLILKTAKRSKAKEEVACK